MDSNPPRSNGRDWRQAAPLMVSIVFGAGGVFVGHALLRDEVTALRVRVDQQTVSVADQARSQAVLEGRVSRGESDNRDVATKLERIGEAQNMMNRRLDALCVALGKRCEP